MDRKTELLEELRRYRPGDLQEAQNHRAVLDLLCYGAAPFSRAEFVPGHITASCFIVDPSSSRILLHHHRRLNRWLQMGGHVDGSESAIEAALREGAEESGLPDLELLTGEVIDVDVHEIPPAGDEPEHLHFDLRYAVATSSPESIMIAPEESNELSWFELDRAIPLMNECASSRAILKIKRLLSGR